MYVDIDSQIRFRVLEVEFGQKDPGIAVEPATKPPMKITVCNQPATPPTNRVQCCPSIASRHCDIWLTMTRSIRCDATHRASWTRLGWVSLLGGPAMPSGLQWSSRTRNTQLCHRTLFLIHMLHSTCSCIIVVLYSAHQSRRYHRHRHRHRTTRISHAPHAGTCNTSLVMARLSTRHRHYRHARLLLPRDTMPLVPALPLAIAAHYRYLAT
jgi:hypothetical protein